MRDLRAFLKALRDVNQVQDVYAEVDPDQELPEIHRRVIEEGGPVLFFHNVKGSPFPVVTNLFGTVDRIRLAFGNEPERFVEQAVRIAQNAMPPKLGYLWKERDFFFKGLKIGMKNRSSAPVMQAELPLTPGEGLDKLPALKQWPLDGGRFVTLPLVYTEHPENKSHNLGMYRIHLYDEKTTGMHWQIHKGGGFHYHVAQEKNESLPVSLFIGGPPALMLSAIAPLPENVPELMLCSLLLGEKLERTNVPEWPHGLVSQAEFAVLGKVPPHKRRPEGPFGDHYGYYSWEHDYPVFEVEKIYHRKDAIYPATVVGKPRQEDFYIGDYLQSLLSPLFPMVMPGVKELHTYGETGFHSLGAARVECRYEREAIASALRILGEGQLSLQKFMMITDGNVVLKDFPRVLEYFLERTDWKKDLFVISNVSQDTLDYTGPKVNEGSKGVWLALGDPIRKLEGQLPSELPRGVEGAKVYVPGCLVVQAPKYEGAENWVQEVKEHPGFKDFQLILVVDDVEEAVASSQLFLWTWFTRFEPAADIYGKTHTLNRFHVGLEAPIFFDCRMKPWYPGTVEPDPDIVKTVDRRWNEYFKK